MAREFRFKLAASRLVVRARERVSATVLILRVFGELPTTRLVRLALEAERRGLKTPGLVTERAALPLRALLDP